MDWYAHCENACSHDLALLVLLGVAVVTLGLLLGLILTFVARRTGG